jgi:hypothetical protein
MNGSLADASHAEPIPFSSLATMVIVPLENSVFHESIEMRR